MVLPLMILIVKLLSEHDDVADASNIYDDIAGTTVVGDYMMMVLLY